MQLRHGEQMAEPTNNPSKQQRRKYSNLKQQARLNKCSAHNWCALFCGPARIARSKNKTYALNIDQKTYLFLSNKYTAPTRKAIE